MIGSFYIIFFGNRVFLQMHSKIVLRAGYVLQSRNQTVCFLQAEFVPPVLDVKRSFRNSPKLFLVRSNAISTHRLSKQRDGKTTKMQMARQHGLQFCQQDTVR